MPLLQTPGPAPDFATHAIVNGQIGHVGLKDYQGEKYVVLVFYPMDFVYAESITPFCARVEEFKKLNCAVLAMSTDSVYSHKAFVKASKADGGLEGKCNIPLLADRSGKISKKYGVFDAEEGIARKALVIIDDRGTARHMVASSLPINKVIDDTLKVISTFQSKSVSAPGGNSSYDVTPSNFPIIRSTHSLVAKHVTKDKWEKLKNIKTKTSGFTLYKAIAVSVEFDNQHCGIYAGDWDSYKDFAIVFDPLIQEYHGILPSATHTSDMDSNKIKGNVENEVPVHSCRIRVGRSIDGFGLSPGITKEQRVGVESLMKKAFANLKGELAGTYYPLTGMDEKVRQQLVDDHFLFVSGDRNLQVAGMERDWPEGRGIYHNKDKTFLTWVNEEDQLRIISMQKGGDVKAVFTRLASGIKAVQESVKKESGKDFCLDKKYGYIHSCPTNLGTGMRASVHVDLPNWTAYSVDKLKARCEELHLQPRGTRGESGGQTGHTYDISNKHRLGYSEVELVQKMIDGVNTLWKEDKALAGKAGSASSGSYSAQKAETGGAFPNIQSKHSLAAKYVTKPVWEQLKGIKTKTSGFTLIQAIACAVQFDNQHCGIYAGDWDSYKDFAPVFDPLIQEYHGISPSAKHSSDMDASKLQGDVVADAPVHSCRIRVGRSIDGFGLSPGITREQRTGVEKLMKSAVQNFPSDLAGKYYPLTGMDEKVRQQLVDDHFLFVSGDRNLTVAGMERDWPEGRGIFHNTEKTFLIWVNEEDQLRIISMQKGGAVREVFTRLAKGIKAVGDSVKKESGKDFCLDSKYGYIHSCPTNLGTGMRASVHIDLPGWTKHSVEKLQARCEELHLQPRGTRGESGGQTGHTYDISNKHRLGYSEVQLVQKMIDGVNTLWKEDKAFQAGGGAAAYKPMPAETNGPFPTIQSKHSLVAKHVTKPVWEKLKGIKTKTSGFTLIQAIACAVEFDNQHCGIYAGDWDSYKDFAPVFDPLIQEYHGISASDRHTSDMDAGKIKGDVVPDAPVHSCRIRVGRSIDGFGLSPGITKEQRVGVEKLMASAVRNFPADLAGKYYPLTGMDEKVRQQLVDDHFLFVSGDRNLTVAGMERDWPEGRGIFHNTEKTFLIWVNEEDQLRIISMQKGGAVKEVFTRLAKGIKAVQDSVKKESGKDFCLDEKYGYIHSCPTNLGTGMRASVHIDLPGWTKHSVDKLKARCEELHLQPRGTRGESGGQTGHTYDISNKHRLGYSEVELVQKMIDGVNTLWKEDKAFQAGGGAAAYKPMAAQTNGPFPTIQSTHSLAAKYVTKPVWEQLKGIKTKTSGFTLIQAIACAVEFDNQHCGIYAGDWDSYKDFAPVFDPLIQEYHGISSTDRHTSDMDANKIKGDVVADAPVHSCRIRVGRSIDGFGLSPGITKEQRVGVEKLMKTAVKNFPADLAGDYYPLTGMDEKVRQQLVDDHFLFVSGDRNLTVAGMERDWPEGRGIFHNKEKTFLIWVNEEDQLRIISMQKGGAVKEVFSRLAKGIKAVGESVKKESGKDFCLDEKYGYVHSCPTNLGTGMRASVHIDLPGWTKYSVEKLQARCEELHLQPRGTRGESGGQTGHTYDISNKHRLGYSEVELVQKMIDGVNALWKEDKMLTAGQPVYVAMPAKTNGPFPTIQSKHSLAAKYVTKPIWDQLKGIQTKTSGFTLIQAIACAVEFDNQHCGIYAGDWDSYKDFAPVFDPLIQEYHGISPSARHTSDMDAGKLKGNVVADAPVHSCRIRVGRSIDGFGLSPGITRNQRIGVEKLMKNAVKTLPADLAGDYYPLTGMDEKIRQQLVDDHFLFVSGDRNLTVAGMERDWPEGRGIFHNKEKTFLIWINEEDQLRIISMQKGGDVKEVFTRLAKGIKAVGDSVKKESGKDFCLDEKYGYVHSCPTNLGTGMRASVHVDLPGWTKHSVDALKARCEELDLQPRGTKGESGGQTGHTYDISNKHRLGYSEVELVQKMIDGVNTLWEEDKKYQ